MKRSKHHFKFFQYVGDTPIVSTKIKILAVFITLILLSTFSTNLIAITLSQRKVIQLQNVVLVGKLTELFNTANSQKQIEAYSQDTQASLDALTQAAKKGFTEMDVNSVALAVRRNGMILFFASPNENVKWDMFSDKAALDKMDSTENKQGSLYFTGPDGYEYFGVYKFHETWFSYIIRANRVQDTNRAMFKVLGITVVLVLVMAIFFVFMGTKILDGLLSNIKNISMQLYDMQQSQTLKPINLEGAPNDDITYLAANFNSLSSTIDNLLKIFQKFVPANVVRKAHQDQIIKLEGKQCNLTILFSDIKSFTYRTEVLGNDIIGLLNVHYDSVIKKVNEHSGVIGSIIGDAILASYGIEDYSTSNKS